MLSGLLSMYKKRGDFPEQECSNLLHLLLYFCSTVRNSEKVLVKKSWMKKVFVERFLTLRCLSLPTTCSGKSRSLYLRKPWKSFMIQSRFLSRGTP